jgi:uncharacterized protein (TIGR04255 family)
VISDFNPLTASTPEEIPLQNAPLVRVIAQVRFPLITSIEKQDFIASFQEAIRKTYPILRSERMHGVIFNSQGASPAQSNTIWRFHDKEDKWRVSLASDFAALETVAYSSRHDFLQRLQHVLSALETEIDPLNVDRLGLRYIDRIEKIDNQDLKMLVRPELAGIAATEIGKFALQSLSETMFLFPDSKEKLMARWGQLPPKTTIDPATIEPIDDSSWILDLDMFREESRTFETQTLIKDTQYFAERIYTFFRWAVTDDFLRRYGGKV